MMPLNLPTAADCFIDANILVYTLIDTPPFTASVLAFMHRVASKEITAYTTSIVLSEALHRIMVLEVLSQFRPTIKPLSYVQRHPKSSRNSPFTPSQSNASAKSKSDFSRSCSMHGEPRALLPQRIIS